MRSTLTRLSQRVDNLTEKVIRFEERTLDNLADSARWQSLTVQVLRTLIEGQAQHEQRLQQLNDISASLQAGQERQERILDYIMRRTNGEDT